jgi:predicted RecA/RadA family phage recombinase
MATNFIQKGARMTYANATGTDISSGDLVPIGATFGIAATDIDAGASGEVIMEGVFEIDAVNSAAISQGNPVYYVASTGEASPTAEDQKYIGIAWAAKAETGTTVKVKIGCGYHPTVNDVA